MLEPTLSSNCEYPSIGPNDEYAVANLPTILPCPTKTRECLGLDVVEGPFRPTVGSSISNLKHLSDTEKGNAGLGTLGMFGAPRNAADWSELWLLSNHHVLTANGAGTGELIFQPRISSQPDQDILLDRDRLNPIASIMPIGMQGHHSFRGPDGKTHSYYIDCAVAKLNSSYPIDRSHSGRLFKSVGFVHHLDIAPGRALRVRILGRDNVLTGTVVNTAATVLDSNGKPCTNNLLIRGLSGTGSRPFATQGDSGSIVIDEFDRAVGLVWGNNLTNLNEAIASHLAPVLDYLKFVPLRHGLAPAGPLEVGDSHAVS